MLLKDVVEKGISYQLISVKADRELTSDIQRNLNRLGYECGAADGLWGIKTREAYERFRAAKKVEDGQFTPAIAKLLLGSQGGGDRHINQAGLELIKSFEGCRLEAYLCPAGVATVGYGSTSGVRLGMKITQQQAEELLRKDLKRFEQGVSKLVKVPLTDNQFGAIVSFAFNVGVGALESSTLLKLLNAGEYRKAADQLLKWDRAKGQVLAGLTRRRKAERELFLK